MQRISLEEKPKGGKQMAKVRGFIVCGNSIIRVKNFEQFKEGIKKVGKMTVKEFGQKIDNAVESADGYSVEKVS